MLEETDRQVSVSTVNRVPYQRNLKSCYRDYRETAHGGKDLPFREMCSSLIDKNKCLAIMTIVVFEGGK